MDGGKLLIRFDFTKPKQRILRPDKAAGTGPINSRDEFKNPLTSNSIHSD